MSHFVSLGALQKATGEYVTPTLANKTDQYMCVDCHHDVIVCKGPIRVSYFRHKIDNSTTPCHYYNHPSETQIHNDAKHLLHHLLQHNPWFHISLVRHCRECNQAEEYDIPTRGEHSMILTEHRFEYNGGLKVADVAYMDNGERICLFEICHTHATLPEHRPEPWFEICATTLLQQTTATLSSSLQLTCMRSELCEECVQRRQEKRRYYAEKNKKYLIRGINRDHLVYLQVPFSQKDVIKQKGGQWDNNHKLWYIDVHKYTKHKDALEPYAIHWVCKECEDRHGRIDIENDYCERCWKESVNWLDKEC